MSSIVKINGQVLSVEYIDAEGRILARISGSDTRYESPLILYSKGDGIPSEIESIKLIQKDSDAEWSDDGFIECRGCSAKLRAQRVAAQAQDILRCWTIHKFTCNALQKKMRRVQRNEDEDEPRAESACSQEHAQGRRRKPVSRNGTPYKRKPGRAPRFSTDERIAFILRLEDIGSASKSKGTVYCKPCRSTIAVGPRFYTINILRHSQSRLHLANGGTPLENEDLTMDMRQPEREISPPSRRDASEAPAADPGPVSCSASKGRKESSCQHPSIGSAGRKQNEGVPATVAVARPNTSEATASGSTPVVATTFGGAIPPDIEGVPDVSGQNKLTAVTVLNLPQGMPKPARLEFHGTVVF